MQHANRKRRPWRNFAGLMLAGILFVAPAAQADETAPQGYLVQGGELGELKLAVLAVGGQVTHEFNRIQALGALLSVEQRRRLIDLGGVLVVSEESLDPQVKPAHG